MKDSGRVIKKHRDIDLDINPLYPNSSSFKVTVSSSGEHLAIPQFSTKCVFLEPLHHFTEENCSVVDMPLGSSLIKVEAHIEYPDEDSPDSFEPWVIAKFYLWCNNSVEPLQIVIMHCIKVNILGLVQTTPAAPRGITFQ